MEAVRKLLVTFKVVVAGHRSGNIFLDSIGATTIFIENLYRLGARGIGVTTFCCWVVFVPPSLFFGHHKNNCVTRLDTVALFFNRRLNQTHVQLTRQYRDLRLVGFAEAYIVGFTEARKACRSTGLPERTIFLCDPYSIPRQHVGMQLIMSFGTLPIPLRSPTSFVQTR